MTKFDQFEDFLKKSTKECWTVPGYALIIFNTDKILYKYVYGVSNMKTNKKLKITDKFCVASCSKSMLCATIFSLIEKKKIPNIFEMPLQDIWSKNINKDYKNVLVKYIACHSSGISDMRECPKKKQKILDKIESLDDPDGTKSRKMLADIVLAQKPSYKPTTKFEYSNWDYGILGAILEKLTSKVYWKSIDKEIMKPLNIDAHFGYYYGDNYVNGHYTDYWKASDKGIPIPMKKNEHKNPKYEHPAGETWLSIQDSAKYCQAYLKIFNKEKSILKLSTVKKMLTPLKNDYAYGFQVNVKKDITIYSHSGYYFHMGTYYTFIPEKNIGMVFCCNGPMNPTLVIEKFNELFVFK